MQQKYIEHYTALLFHKWFMNVCKECGDTPIRAAIQNFLYVQDPTNPSKVRIQSFIEGLLNFYETIKDLPDPEVPPTVFEAGVSIPELGTFSTLPSNNT